MTQASTLSPRGAALWTTRRLHHKGGNVNARNDPASESPPTGPGTMMSARSDTKARERHLLVVDDDDRIRGLLKEYLTREGFRVSAAADAASARRLLGTLDFDLLVFDVMMPGEDGFSLTQWVRNDGPSRATPVLMLTARDAAGDRIEGLTRGADDYLAKPFEPQELLLRIEAILRRSGGRASGRGAIWPRPLPVRSGPGRADPRGRARPADRGRGPPASPAGRQRPCGGGPAGPGARDRRSQRAGGRRAGHAPAPQDRARSQGAALSADGARGGLHAGARLMACAARPAEPSRRSSRASSGRVC